MNAVPEVIAGLEVDPSGKYKCPLCKVQSAGEEADTGWVKCPMVRDKIICLGSCLDHQGAARSDNFEEHYDRKLFDDLSTKVQRSVSDLRRTCLEHQIEVLDDQLCHHSEDAAALRAFRAVLQQRLRMLRLTW